MFKDITPLLANAAALREAVRAMAERCRGVSPTVIAGIESRGFLFATALAIELGVGMVPIRKRGKLPYEKVSREYALEYGTDVIEMHVDAVSPNDRVVVVDDVIATGGTLAASIALIEEHGAKVVQALVLVELSFLNGRAQLGTHPVEAILTY